MHIDFNNLSTIIVAGNYVLIHLTRVKCTKGDFQMEAELVFMGSCLARDIHSQGKKGEGEINMT